MSAASKILMGSGGGADLSISPDFDSKSEWTFADDGALNIPAGTSTFASMTTHTGRQFTITANRDVTVDIVMWGGGAGSGWIYANGTAYTTYTGYGGGGGYAAGRLVLRSGVDYVLQIAGGGIAYTTSGTYDYPGSLPTRATYLAGGLYNNYSYGAQAGGYSGIFKTTTVSQSTAKLIAGGGGSGGDNRYGGSGGAGGGSSGQNASGIPYGQGGTGGSQSAGGSAAGTLGNTVNGKGIALAGGMGAANTTYNSNGGGGGYWGGGSSGVGGGGGGSGYYDSSDSDLTNETITVGNYQTPAQSSHSDRGGAGQGATQSMSTQATGGRIYMDEVQ